MCREMTEPKSPRTETPSEPRTVGALLDRNAASYGNFDALLSESGPPLSHRELRDRVQALVQTLNGLGVGRGDRVAIVLPQGSELAVAFLAVAAGATAAPLNPAYLESEFTFYLQDLQARALIVPQ